MVRDSSVDSYYKCIEEGIITGRQIEVLNLIRSSPMRTDREYADLLGVDDPNYVRPRRKELFDLGLVIDGGKRLCSVTGRTVYVWKWNNEISFEDVLDNQKVLTEYVNECVVNGVITRTIVSKSFMEVLGKAMVYVETFGIKRKDIKLKHAVYDGGVYRVIITRGKK